VRITTRPLQPADADDIHAITTSLAVLPTTVTVPFTSRASVAEEIANQDPNRHVLGAVLRGRVVGYGGLIVGKRARTRHCGHLFVEVHERSQGKGVGTALVGAILDLADRWLGLARVQLEVNADNDRAVRLYERFGFEREGRLRGNILSNGRYVDSFVMGRVRREQL
jgi:L-phenylalanine/L-methionine N-acetyltransferase